MKRVLWGACISSLLFGCASQVYLPVLPADHPANPQASESPVFSHPAEEKKTTSSPEIKKLAYSCPMHPEIQSETASKCSKCGMNLVKEKK